ncbi:MAG: ParB-like nuclease domain-containing protein [Chloroflexota bacterium]|nr:MAG: ParB-like nuclease domain-containing protein [Chloroflexota bacterium]
MLDFDSEYDPLSNQVDHDWRQARRKVLYQRVVCAVSQCSVDMMSFGEIRKTLRLGTPHFRGLQQIPVEQIRGSVGRYDDFTSAFLPRKDFLKDRWTNVEKLLIAGKAPPIDVYQVGSAYFVVDGNHRVSVARQLGMETIEAIVTECSTPFEIGPDDDVDELLIEAEKSDFLGRLGDENSQMAEDIIFSCAGCYRDLNDQIEAYRLGMETKEGRPVSTDQSFAAWHGEVYTSAVNAIHDEGLIDLFPERTEADLFIWSWQNSHVLEEKATEADSSDAETVPKRD